MEPLFRKFATDVMSRVVLGVEDSENLTGACSGSITTILAVVTQCAMQLSLVYFRED